MTEENKKDSSNKVEKELGFSNGKAIAETKGFSGKQAAEDAKEGFSGKQAAEDAKEGFSGKQAAEEAEQSPEKDDN